MKNRLSRLLKVLEWYPRAGKESLDALAHELGTSPATIRRDLRDLHDAGAFQHAELPVGEEALAENTALQFAWIEELARSSTPANDTVPETQPHAGDSTEDALLAMYVGARFLATEGEPDTIARAHRVIAKIEREATAALQLRLRAADARYRFGPAVRDRRARQLILRAITERRVLRIRYKGERDLAARERDVEPLAQVFVQGHWNFYAFCRSAGEVRQFRLERCEDLALTTEYFTERGGFTLGGFLQQQKKLAR